MHRDRTTKKWQGFSAVVPLNTLKSNKTITPPSLSQNEVQEFEELLKFSLYTSTSITITYLKNNAKLTQKKTVKSINSVNKNIYFTDKTYINFRQIYKIKRL